MTIKNHFSARFYSFLLCYKGVVKKNKKKKQGEGKSIKCKDLQELVKDYQFSSHWRTGESVSDWHCAKCAECKVVGELYSLGVKCCGGRGYEER